MSGMARYGWRWCIQVVAFGSGLVLGGAIASENSAFAQIVPDRTLPNNSSVTTQDNIRTITGGTQAGSNLFHSFEQFSVPTGTEAYVNNTLDIQNILTRVTGKSISNIDGILKANGTANLFFMNPNGIIFGRDAKLDIGGSFLATTANAIQFGDRGFFSASNPEAVSPLLTVIPSALLFNQIAAASIQNNSVAPSKLDPSGRFTARGLRVRDGQSLLLVGGNVSMDGGGLFGFGGRVELGGLAGAGTVGLNGDGKNLSLSFPDELGRGDVSLTKGANVNVRADNGGSIAINARNLELAGQSELLAGIAEGLGSDSSKAGNIEVNAQGAINLKDESGIRNFVQSRAIGQGGDIRIGAGSLSLTNGSLIFTSTYGRGDAGNVSITARDTVSSDGLRNNASGVYSSVLSGAVGKGGDISITTGSLSFTNGAVLITSNNGQGDAGSITITARDRVSFDGVGRYGRFTSASGVYSSIIPQVVGNGGDISITAGSLTVRNGARLSARTFGYGDAGSITITAKNSVSFDGVGIRGSSAAFSSVEPGAVGNGGGISITSGSLTVQNGAQLNASSDGQGTAGDIKLSSNSIRVENQAAILARTASGNGGNITLEVRDLLLLRRGSQISTTAGTADAGGDGGNITINTPNGSIVAVPSENSDITANAFTGKGGNVEINASGVFGTQFRERENPQKSDITASSQFGINGTVEINTLNLDPNQGLINLPTEPSEPKLAQGCTADVAQNQSSFIITGRGGLPPNPRQVLRSQAVEVDWVTLDAPANNATGEVQSRGRQRRGSGGQDARNANNVNTKKTEIVEAQGWVRDALGNITLVATAPTAAPHFPWLTPASCPVR